MVEKSRELEYTNGYGSKKAVVRTYRCHECEKKRNPIEARQKKSEEIRYWRGRRKYLSKFYKWMLEEQELINAERAADVDEVYCHEDLIVPRRYVSQEEIDRLISNAVSEFGEQAVYLGFNRVWYFGEKPGPFYGVPLYVESGWAGLQKRGYPISKPGFLRIYPTNTDPIPKRGGIHFYVFESCSADGIRLSPKVDDEYTRYKIAREKTARVIMDHRLAILAREAFEERQRYYVASKVKLNGKSKQFFQTFAMAGAVSETLDRTG